MQLKRLSMILIALIGLGALTSFPTRTAAQVDLFVDIFPPEIPQGRTSLIRVVAPNDITRVEALFGGRQIPLYRSAESDWVGFLAADMNASTGDTTVDVYTWTGEQLNPPLPKPVKVTLGGFLTQEFSIPGNQVNLLDPTLNQNEINTLFRVYSRRTSQKLWEGAFLRPIAGEQISEFGGVRNYNNGTLQGARHTGIDFRANSGEPVIAAATGRVVFAGLLPIHGNHIVLDHGWGVLTGYSHLSEIYVVPGQRILGGTQIGAVGATGRVQGAHLHFEVTVGGLWVDPLQFLTLNVPPAAPEVAAR